jgi:hypothetical protein
MTKYFYKLLDNEGNHLQTYDHPVKAEKAADHYWMVKGEYPQIIKIKGRSL